jgi:hypothetical protein
VTPWSGPAITNIIGASGDDDVRQELVKAARSDRIMGRWVVELMVELATGTREENETKEMLRGELSKVTAELSGPSPNAR